VTIAPTAEVNEIRMAKLEPSWAPALAPSEGADTAAPARRRPPPTTPPRRKRIERMRQIIFIRLTARGKSVVKTLAFTDTLSRLM
jgi:hypothetical protein